MRTPPEKTAPRGNLRRGLADKRRVQTVTREEHQFSSTRVARAWYTSADHLLEVWFVDGTRWQYHAVPDKVWDAFRNTSSPGTFVTDTLNGFRNGRAPG